MRGIRGAAMVAACALVVTLGTGTAALAALTGDSTTPRTALPTVSLPLPPGWTLDGSGALTWSSPTRIPLGDARIEVAVDGRALGVGTLSHDQRSVSVRVAPDLLVDPAVDWSALSVTAAGRRLDTGATGPQPQSVAPTAFSGELPPVAPLLAVDPGKPGPYTTVTGEYSSAGVTIAGLPAKVEVKAVVVSPRGTTGPRPLVLFLHGRHETCFKGKTQSTADWPCPTGFTLLPSYRGYLETQRLLASQGYDTVSISANGINGQDWLLADGGAEARSELIRYHLALWQSWSLSDAAHAAAPAVVKAAPLADLSRVLLVGHSRGGEGVNRAALDSTTGTAVPWTIKGIVHIGPTAFGQNPAPGVPAVVLLPYCDGDVSDLQGQAYIDAARDAGNDPVLRSAVLVFGANHNFFNAEWTPGVAVAPAFDDWGDNTDQVCGSKAGSTRLTSPAQRQVGSTYVAAAAAVFVAGDTGPLPLLDGTNVRAASAGTARVLASALGAARTSFLVPTSSTPLIDSAEVTARTCKTAEANDLDLQCIPDAEFGSTPHFLPQYYVAGEPSRRALDVSWTGVTGRARIDVSTARSLTGATSLDLRVAVPSGAAKATFAVVLGDAAGHRLTLPDTSVTGLPADPSAFSGKTWAQEVRLPLTPSAVLASKLNLSAITRIEVLPRSATGQVFVLDTWGRRDGLSTAAPLRLARVDVGSVTIDEGATNRTVALPITVTGPATTAGRIWVFVVDPTSGDSPVGHLVDVPAGAHQFTVGIPVPGDLHDDPDVLLYQVAVKAVRGLAVGDYVGGLTVLDDDPSPTLTVVPVATTVEEGADLVWRLQLSEITDQGVFVQLNVTAPGKALPPELDTKDVPVAWLADHEVDTSGPRRPLSEAAPFVYAYIEPGTDSVEIRVPTLVDTRSEAAESIVLSITEAGGAILPDPAPKLVGTVNDPA